MGFRHRIDSIFENTGPAPDPRELLPRDVRRSLYGATLWHRITRVEQTESAYYIEIGKALRKEEFRVLLRNKRIITVFPRAKMLPDGTRDEILVIAFVKYLEDVEPNKDEDLEQ